jgi:putative transposase
MERGDYPSEHLASLNDEALMQILTLYVVDVYHNTPHRGLNGETPNNCWDRLSKQIGIVPKLAEATRRRAFGERDRRTVTGRGVEKFGIDYACPALQHVFLHSHEREVDIRYSLEDLGWILVHVDGKWHPARAIQKCFEGVSFEEWQRTARELRLRYRAEAQLNEAVVAQALSKIMEINAREQARFGNVLKAQTPAGLKRARDDLFVGLSIIPEQSEEDFDLPPDPDLFGHVVPYCGASEQDSASESLAEESDTSMQSKWSTRWRFDDDK